VHLIGFATRCFTAVGTHLSGFVDRYQSGSLPSTTRLGRNRQVVEALNRLASESAPTTLIEAAHAIERYPDVRLYRRELWREMKTTVLTFLNGTHESLQDTAWYVRDRARRNGRRPELNVVSRTLLIKGLEFDHSVVVDTDKFNAKEFYVALTRGKHRLTVLSSHPVVKFDSVSNVL
jgi:hypothetical protein